MEGNRILLSFLGTIFLSSLGYSMILFPRVGHISSFKPRWPGHFGGFGGDWFPHPPFQQDYFPTFRRRHFQMRDMFNPFQFQRHFGHQSFFHQPFSGYRQDFFPGQRPRPARRHFTPVFPRRSPFIGSRSSFPQTIRIPLSGSPIIDNWSHITGSGFVPQPQRLIGNLLSERRNVDTPNFPIRLSHPITAPHALVAWVGGDDDEGTSISISSQSQIIPGAGALPMTGFETIDPAIKVTPIGKAAGGLIGPAAGGKIGSAAGGKIDSAAGGKIGSGVSGTIAKAVKGAVGKGASGTGKKGLKSGKILDGPSIKKVPHAGKGFLPVGSKEGGHTGKSTLLNPVKSTGIELSKGVVAGGSVAIGKSSAVVEESEAVAKVSGVKEAEVTDSIAQGTVGKAGEAVAKANIDLKIQDADTVKINLGNDNGKVINDAGVVKGEKSVDGVIAGKITSDLKIQDADTVKINVGSDNGKVIKDAGVVKAEKSVDGVINGKVTADLKIQDADTVKINIGNDNGKVIKDADVVKGEKSAGGVIAGKVTVGEAKEVVAAVAEKTVAAKTSAAVGKISGSAKQKITLPKIIHSSEKIVVPVKKDLAPHKAPIVKL